MSQQAKAQPSQAAPAAVPPLLPPQEANVELSATAEPPRMARKEAEEGPAVFFAVRFQYQKRREEFHFTGIDLGGPP
jgi:hypothetical protein